MSITSTLTQGVLHLELSSADGMNTMDDAWFDELAEAVRGATADAGVRCVLLSSRGKAFCAGLNLAALQTSELRQRYAGSALERLVTALVELPKPLVAAVHGAAIGGGATLLLHCDLAVAAADAKFRLPFVSLGIVPELGSSYLLPRAAGSKLANELILLGNLFDAPTAQRAGIVNAVVAPGEELALARQWAEQIAALAPGPVQAAKRLLRSAQNEGLAAALLREGAGLVAGFSGPVAAEAAAAFTEKRRPDFSPFH